MNVVLCGFHWAGCKALNSLLQRGYNVFVFTHESPPHIASLLDLCKKIGVPYSLENISNAKLPFKADIISSVYYRYIIKPQIIASCNGKIFNLHPSLLPKYRGCSSLTWAMINGEPETGFTYHYIDEGCDTGRIITQQHIVIEQYDNQHTLYYRVMFKALEAYEQALDLVINGYRGMDQQGEPTYYKRGCPFNGEIDEEWDDDYVERFIRAMQFPPYPPAKFKGHEILSFDNYKALK